MACNNSCNNVSTIECEQRTGGSGFVIIVVLYILLAIILSSCFFY